MSYYWRQFEHNQVQIESDQDGTNLSVCYPDGWVWRAYYPELIWDGGDYGNGPFTVEARSATANGNLERCAKMIETLTEEIVVTIPYMPIIVETLKTHDEVHEDRYATDPAYGAECDVLGVGLKCFGAAMEKFDEKFDEWLTSAYHNLDGVDVITPLRDDNGNLIGLEVIPSEDHVSTSDSCKTLARWFDVDVSVYPGTYANG